MTTADVTILGAGPYGLAAHRRQIKGLESRVFGEPMDFRKSHMPEGMSFGTLMFFVCATDFAQRWLGALHDGHRISKRIRPNLLLS